jgi:DNA polymerase-1
MAMIRCEQILRTKKNASLLLSIHDELLFEVEDSEINTLAPELKRAMEGVFPLSIPLVVEMKIGKKWGTMKSHE